MKNAKKGRLRTNPFLRVLALLLVVALSVVTFFNGGSALWRLWRYGWYASFSSTQVYSDLMSTCSSEVCEYYRLSQQSSRTTTEELRMNELAEKLGNTNYLFELANVKTGDIVLSNYLPAEQTEALLAGESNSYTLSQTDGIYGESYYLEDTTVSVEATATDAPVETTAAEEETEIETDTSADSGSDWDTVLESFGYFKLIYYDGETMFEIAEEEYYDDLTDLLVYADEGCLYGSAANATLKEISYEIAEDLVSRLQLAALLSEDETAASEEETEYSLTAGVVSGLPIDDEFSEAYYEMRSQWVDIQFYVLCGAISGAGLLLALGWLLCCAGWKREEDGTAALRPSGFDRLWLEPLLLVDAGVSLGLIVLALFACGWLGEKEQVVGLLSVIGTLVLLILLSLAMTVASRIKNHMLWESTFLHNGGKRAAERFRRLGLVQKVRALWKLAHENLRLTVRVLIAYLLFLVLTWVLLNPFTNALGIVLWLVLSGLVLMGIEYWALYFWEIRKGAHEIAAGNVDYSIPSDRMPADLRDVAEQLNHISEGVALAVEERMKSERFRAELITNVSHDLKTPLTSIINYIDLLKKLDVQDESAREYIEVLDRKSQRLKKLTEDLVEASKASTGSIHTQLETLNLTQLISQALGEYDEKLSAARLTPVVTQPEEPLLVLADGRHLWRVMDNLLGNCVKYALPGTRLYIQVEQQGELASVTLKNISRDPLNLSEEELLERFVRGDASRTTEGSGLGLSIAQSLMLLMHGTFRLQVDGDLFKARFEVPTAGE